MILQFIELDALVRSKQKIGVLGIAMITPEIQMLTLIRDAAGIGQNPRHSYINKLAVLMHVSQHLQAFADRGFRIEACAGREYPGRRRRTGLRENSANTGHAKVELDPP